MKSTRRELLSLTGLGALAALSVGRRVGAQADLPSRIVRRIADAVREYEDQGFHRTATAVDNTSGEWLADQVRQAGLRAGLESFPVDRVDLGSCNLTIANRQVAGIPLFDGAFTTARGIRGRLGALGSQTDIGLVETAVNAAATGALGEARRTSRHQAIIAITRGGRPGLCPSNADSFLSPFGPPVLQVSSEEAGWLRQHASLGSEVHLVAQADRVRATANNVTAELRGTEPTLSPFVIMTPRSGWYSCGSERGGGIACWLETMRGLATSPIRRSVLFVASSGHELGHLGIDAFIARRGEIVKNATAWLHLGANIGAATTLNNNLLQASDDGLDALLTGEMKAVGLAVARRAARAAVPAGEAEAVHRGGGRYVSAIGGNALFHHINDRGPDTTDAATIARFSQAFVAVARAIARSSDQAMQDPPQVGHKEQEVPL